METRCEASAERSVDRAKDELRDKAKSLRLQMGAPEREQADERIRFKVLDLPEYRTAPHVFTYLSFGAEVDTRGIIEAAWLAGKAVALPRCEGPRLMRWYEVHSLENLELSPFGVREPPADPSLEVDPADCANPLAIVPGLSFDGEGYRLGYGGGYYDAFLSSFQGTSVGLCRRAQLAASSLPRGPYDVPVDIIITDGWVQPMKQVPGTCFTGWSSIMQS